MIGRLPTLPGAGIRRKADELPYQLHEIGDRNGLVQALADLPTFVALRRMASWELHAYWSEISAESDPRQVYDDAVRRYEGEHGPSAELAVALHTLGHFFRNLGDVRPTSMGLDVHTVDVLRRQKGRLVQPLVVSLDYTYGAAIDAVVRVAGQEPRPLRLSFGQQRLDYVIPAVEMLKSVREARLGATDQKDLVEFLKALSGKYPVIEPPPP